MPRFFVMLCLQKMRNGMGRSHAGFCKRLVLQKNNGMGELTIQQPVRRASSIL